MKYRIAKKKLKKNTLLNLWIKSDNEWCITLDNIVKKYPKGTDINDYNEIDKACYSIGCDMMRYDWFQVLKIGNKMGFNFPLINRYYNERRLNYK